MADEDFVLNLDFGGPPKAAPAKSQKVHAAKRDEPAPPRTPGGNTVERGSQNGKQGGGGASTGGGGRGRGGRGDARGGGGGRGRGRGASAAGATSGPEDSSAPSRGGGQGRGGRGGRGGDRGKPFAKGRRGGAPPGDVDEQLKAADSDEEGEVGALVALMAKRDAALEQELAAHDNGRGANSKEPEGVVDFGDEDDDEGRRRRRKKFATQGSGGEGGGDGAHGGGHQGKQAGKGKGKGGKGAAATSLVKHVPGKLTHAEVGESAAEIFGDGGMADEQEEEEEEAVLEAGDEEGEDEDVGEAEDGEEGGRAIVTASAAAAAPGSWESLGVTATFAPHLVSLGYSRPTKVQCGTLPVLLGRKDALVRAATGSGKTLCYLVPIIQDLAGQNPRLSRAEGTCALIIAPTRELCLQIQDVAVNLCKRYHYLVPGIVIGGENRSHEKARLRKGVTVLAATPGRLLDHLTHTASFKIGELRWLVLDEADRLLDLGFEAKLKEVVDALDKAAAQAHGEGAPRVRVSALLSATLHTGLAGLASLSLSPSAVAVGFTMKKSKSGVVLAESGGDGGSEGGASGPPQGGVASALAAAGGADATYTIPSQLKQGWLEVEAKQRLVVLAGLLRQKLLGGGPKAAPRRKAVVFLSSCDGVELHHALLTKVWSTATGAPLLAHAGTATPAPVLKLHGDMPQGERTAAFVTFSQASTAVLLCTDVAARGLDFPDVTLILQYDLPSAPAEYVHRVGRTARMGHAGEAFLFLMPHEAPYLGVLTGKGISLTQESSHNPLKWLPRVDGGEYGDGGDGAGGGGRGRKRDRDGDGGAKAVSFAVQRRIMQVVASDPELRQLASDAFRSFVRAYATHSAANKAAIHVKNLHLGHVAFAHALKDTPTMLGASGSGAERKRKRAAEVATKARVAKKKLYQAARKAQE